jgi:predicted RNA-binding Zn-ribbon protein involved in translation (DUF1610 family)
MRIVAIQFRGVWVMKDSNIVLQPVVVYNPMNQCFGKKQYRIKRRAINAARELAADTGKTFTVYECPHCGKYHVGSVREE